MFMCILKACSCSEIEEKKDALVNIFRRQFAFSIIVIFDCVSRAEVRSCQQ